ncbi:MAG: DUF932 domain-containing protein, partial [Candidatus Omnitrophota bacterium]
MNTRIPLTIEQLWTIAPSIFAVTPVSNVSTRYCFVPTMRVIETLGKTGWYPVSAQQTKARTSEGMIYKKHLIRFGHADLPAINGCAPEIVLLNSHDTTSSFCLMSGLFRFACLNGLLVYDAMFSAFVIRHIGYRDQQILEAEYRLVDEFPRISRRISEFQNIPLSWEERIDFAGSAARVRWHTEVPAINPVDLLVSRRSEDAGETLWTVLNVIQENLFRGGIAGFSRKNTARR